MTIHTAQDGPTPLTAASSSTSKACVPRNLSGASTDLWVVMRGEEGRWMARAPALSGRFHPQFRDRNRRDIGKSQSIWTNSKMETPGSLVHQPDLGGGERGNEHPLVVVIQPPPLVVRPARSRRPRDEPTTGWMAVVGSCAGKFGVSCVSVCSGTISRTHSRSARSVDTPAGFSPSGGVANCPARDSQR
jgi:hypothetical protein